MSKLIKELTKEWKEYKGNLFKLTDKDFTEMVCMYGFDKAREISNARIQGSKPTIEGFMDYLTNKEL